jgi:DNA-binding transcriptional LysR family regulator
MFFSQSRKRVVMNTDLFRYFTVLYDCRSYARAAKRIPMTRLGLVRAVERLENELGVPLFTQDDSGILMPTEYAEKLNEFILNHNNTFKRLEDAFDQVRTQSIHKIRLGTPMGFPGFLDNRVLIEFEKKNPNIFGSSGRCVSRINL